MRLAASALAAALLCTLGLSQGHPSAPIELVDEPHHTLLLQNPETRVFRLKLEPNQVTLPHLHRKFYAYLSLRAVKIGNEVRGRKTVVTFIEAEELHTSKGGFAVAERNNSSEPADLLVVEATKPGGVFGAPMGGFRYHDAAFGELFEAPACRGYSMVIAAGGRTEQHEEHHDRLLVAISDLSLREVAVGQAPFELQMKAGDIQWIPRGMIHSTTNVGEYPATFITFEFN